MTLPLHIVTNLKDEYPLRAYQREAIHALMERLHKLDKHQDFHGLFHMATGSGKTMIMAASILHLYALGFRHFIFFVNSKSILEKTKYNFVRPGSSKYLFTPEIRIDHQTTFVKSVSNLDEGSIQNINIVFTSIQKLHSALRSPSENALTLHDFEGKEVVLISDESHHINVKTKIQKPNQANWEQTIQTIQRASRKCILLEFTATMPLDHPAVSAKYQDKLVYSYTLRKYRDEGYSKWVETHYSPMSDIERAIEAMMLSQLRFYIFAHYDISIQPILLIKSHTIAKSRKNRHAVADYLMHIKSHEVKSIIERSDLPLVDILTQLKISQDQLWRDIQAQFGPSHMLTIDSKNDSETHQIALNSLEDTNNPYRCIFAVDKLNEGWDVLNLFDIVRMGTSTSHKITKKSTIAEAQLIGRGARYCPFQINISQDRFRRKYDGTDHILRLCETLYFHASYIPEYISLMERTLIETAVKSPEEVTYRPDTQSKPSTIKISGLSFGEGTHSYSSHDLHPRILSKAIQRNPFYQFDNLIKHITNLESVSDLFDQKFYCQFTEVLDENRPQQYLKQLDKLLQSIQRDILDRQIKQT